MIFHAPRALGVFFCVARAHVDPETIRAVEAGAAVAASHALELSRCGCGCGAAFYVPQVLPQTARRELPSAMIAFRISRALPGCHTSFSEPADLLYPLLCQSLNGLAWNSTIQQSMLAQKPASPTRNI